jgi:hypothetical protein
MKNTGVFKTYKKNLILKIKFLLKKLFFRGAGPFGCHFTGGDLHTSYIHPQPKKYSG